MWIFKCYITSSGIDAIDKWLSDQDAEVQAEADATLEFFSMVPRDKWIRPKFDLLKGKDKFSEIRIKAKSGEYRIIGYFGPERHTYTLLIGFRKQRDSDTNNACKTARNRKKEVENGKSRSKPCQFP